MASGVTPRRWERTKAPEIIAIHAITTASCNLACSYCYQDIKGEQVMEWRTLRRAVDLLLASGRRDVRLTFCGGEPLLRFDLVRRAVEYARRMTGDDSWPRFALVTNGTLLTDDVARFLERYRVLTRISLDGVRPAQDLRGRGTFRILGGLLTRLRKARPDFFRDRVEIAAVFSSRTLEHLAASFEYFLEKGVENVLLAPIKTWDGRWDLARIQDLDRQFETIHRLSLDHLRRTGAVPLTLFRKERSDRPYGPPPPALCGVGRGVSLAVDSDGELYACALFIESFQSLPPFLRDRLGPMRLGSIRDPGLPERLAVLPAAARAAGIFNDKERKHSSYGLCRSCRFLNTCNVCPVAIGLIPGNDDPDRIPDHLCAFNLVSRKWREKFPSQPWRFGRPLRSCGPRDGRKDVGAEERKGALHARNLGEAIPAADAVSGRDAVGRGRSRGRRA